jgi:hypothetical protein
MAKQKLAYINDPDVWNYITGLSNFSAWVRDQARREMQGGIDPMIVDYINCVMGGRGVVSDPVIIPALTEDFDPESGGFF